MTPYYYHPSSIKIPEMEWLKGSTYTRLYWNVLYFLMSCLPGSVLVLMVLVGTESLIGTLTGPIALIEIVIVISLSYYVTDRLTRKDYRYAAYLTYITKSFNTTDFSQKEFFENLFDGIFKHSDSHRDVETDKSCTQLIYTFEGNTSSLSVIIPNEDYHDQRTLLVMKVIEEEDLPHMLHLKELVGMALGI